MRSFAFLNRLEPDQTPSQTEQVQVVDNEKFPTISDDRTTDDASSEKVTEYAQAGVQKIEATTSVWTRKALIIAYGMQVAPQLQTSRY